MELKQKIENAMKAALKAKEAVALSTLRMLLAAIKQREIDERVTLSDSDVISVIEKMIKQRRESIKMYEEAGRDDLAASEKSEIEILQTYMPKQLTESEVEDAVGAAIAESGATGPKDMGAVMGLLKGKLAGRADFSLISKLVKSKLQ
ncbi:MAG: GatB/YqeY domain-containing protein [Betaproteobacteria bacterium]